MLTLRGVGEETDIRALRMFGLKREELSGGWKEQHNEEHQDFYS
jgi:hypothetical protein